MTDQPTTVQGIAEIYRAAASTINTATTAGRSDHQAIPIRSAEVMTDRVAALEDVAGALLVALATLRDGTEPMHPNLSPIVQAATDAAWKVEHELRGVRRVLAGPTTADLDDDE